MKYSELAAERIFWWSIIQSICTTKKE